MERQKTLGCFAKGLLLLIFLCALLALFPRGKIAAKDKEFSSDLNDRYVVLFHNPAKMPDRETGQFSCVWDIQKHFFSRIWAI